MSKNKKESDYNAEQLEQLSQISANADEIRALAVERLQTAMDAALEKQAKVPSEQMAETFQQLKDTLWSVIVVFEKNLFVTAKGLDFRYTVNRHNGIPGNEIFIDRKAKSVTRSTVELALKRVLELNAAVKGPKQIGVFGASYLYPMFLRFGVIRSKEKKEPEL